MKLILFLGTDFTELFHFYLSIKSAFKWEIHLSVATRSGEMPSKANSGPNKFACRSIRYLRGTSCWY